jgi:ketosteroid isomerase-like protein
MSRENVEIVRRVFEATNRGEARSVLELYHPEVELEAGGALGSLVGGGVYTGRDGIRRFYRAYYEAWEHVDYEIEELIDAGDLVVSVVTNRGRGRASGIALDWRVPGLWTIKDRHIVRVVFFSSRDEALQAAGLSD